MTRYDRNSVPPDNSSPSVGTNPNEIIPIYRLYNPVTTEHLFTSDKYENQLLSNNYGWKNEGVGWYAPQNGRPVYRLFNPNLNDHLYTTDENEVYVLTTSQGWIKDNNGAPLFYSDGFTNVYRLYNPSSARHHLTKDFSEYIYLSNSGWKPEGTKLLAVY